MSYRRSGTVTAISPAALVESFDGRPAPGAHDVHARRQARHVRLGDAVEAEAEDVPPEHVVDDGLLGIR